jgi:hypothetical protein
MTTIRRFVGPLAFAGALAAQQTLSGPVSGLVFDEQVKAVREIAGVPGAAYLMSAVAAGDEGSISPDGSLALVREGGQIVLLRIARAVTRVALASAETSLGEIAWSADSRAVAVECDGIQLFVDLDSTPRRVPLGSLDGEAIALATTGRVVAAGVNGGVWLLDADGARRIAVAGEPEGLAIADGTLYVADRARKEVVAIHNFDSAPEAALIANASAGLEGPVAVAVEGSSLFIADSSRKLLQISIASGALSAEIALDFDPARLDPFNRNLYRMDSGRAGGGPVQILRSGPEPAVYFIPAGASLED